MASQPLPSLWLAGALALGGCVDVGSLLAGGLAPAQPGVIAGLVTFDGAPAAGKRVGLGAKTAVTDAEGRYRFAGVTAGRYSVTYLGAGDRPGALPNEVATWRSAPFEVGAGAGATLPAFDVAYNGPLYPDVGMALVVNAESPVPFHWSTHRAAKAYRLVLTGAGGFSFSAPWSEQPTAVFAAPVTPGSYEWRVEIDGGASGTGVSRPRPVDL